MEYKYIKLPELLETIIDNRGKTVPTSESGIKLIATNCILNNKLFPIYDKVRYISKDTYQNWFRGHPKPGDIIFVNKGTPGKVCMVPDPIDFCIAQDMMAFRVNNNIVYNKYLFAILRSKKIQNQILNSTVGTLIPHFKKEQLKDIIIPVPDFENQKKIGNIYYDISYKIELNNQINDNLQELANKLYEDKFIVNRDENWEEYNLTDIVNIYNGYSYKGTELIENSNIGMATIKNFERTGGFKEEGFKALKSSKVKDTQYVNKFDVLVACTDLTQNADIIGNAILLLNKSNYDDIVISMDLVKIVARLDYIDNFIVYAILNSKEFKNFALGYTSGTTVLHLNKSCFNEYIIKLPTKEEIIRFSNLIKPIYIKMAQLSEENKTLEQLRDILLPKLMNGEIDLDKIEI